jgi:acyl-CoA synthetase (AMP-forming)/AMP-acid ligase II
MWNTTDHFATLGRVGISHQLLRDGVVSSLVPPESHDRPVEKPFRDLIEERAVTRERAAWLLGARVNQQVSYRQVRERTRDWANVFSSVGLRDGDRVGLLVSDPLEFGTCFVSALAYGLWVAPLDPTLEYPNGQTLDERATRLHLNAIVSDRAAPVALSTTWIDLHDGSSGDTASDDMPSPNGGGVILATSGTTGTPKIMALPVAQLVYAADLIARHNELTTVDRGFNPLPLWHVNAEVVALLATFLSGSSLVLDDGFHRTDFWSLMDRLEVTWINAVPAIISRLVTRHGDEAIPQRVRFIRSASAPLSGPLLEAFEAQTNIVVVESYGMTEAASQICANPLRGPRKRGSVGPAVGVQLRVIASPISSRADAHHPGHVEIRGASVIKRYEGDGYEDRFDPEGWLRTGDLGYLDEDDYLFLVGRSDDVINRGGEKIFPREIEDVILGVPGVLGAAVIGAADEVFHQVPVAFVQLENVTSSTPLDAIRTVTAQIRNELAVTFVRTRRPVELNVVVHLPVNATGKVKKGELLDDTVEIITRESLQ